VYEDFCRDLGGNFEDLRRDRPEVHNRCPHPAQQLYGQGQVSSNSRGGGSGGKSRSSSSVGLMDSRGPGKTTPVNTAALEESITLACVAILKGASSGALKAVELANTLRARVGTEPLAQVHI
jgi:hypothetical protein